VANQKGRGREGGREGGRARTNVPVSVIPQQNDRAGAMHSDIPTDGLLVRVDPCGGQDGLHLSVFLYSLSKEGGRKGGREGGRKG
jgi:hypothetical protein